jgi:uroporphyrinogen III methyltransferase/synthase
MTIPTVYLVGAGPGDPGLLTLRAVECLSQADLVVYDKLASPRMLDHAPPTAERICVADLADCHVERYRPIQQALIEGARQGRRVVRLKGGDPFVFGRGGEEAEALRQAGIPFEVVPGVTAALGAAACAGIPLTHRQYASAVALVTGHEDPTKPDTALDWGALARFPGTLVFYMGMSRLARNVAALLGHGKPTDTPAAVVHWATTGEQQTVEAPLSELPAAVQKAGVTAPAVVLVGSVVGLRQRLAWFERRPLLGKRVLVTRPRHQAGDLVRRLELLGAVPLVLPAVAIGPPADWGPGYHLEPDVVPAEFRSEALAAALGERVAGQAVLLARADRGRELLREELVRTARRVEQVAVYRQVDAVDAGAPVLDCLRRGEIDYVTVTSSNSARALVGALDEVCRGRLESGAARLVSISPVTSAAVRELGLPVAAEATVYTGPGLVEALVRLAAAGG